MDMVLANELQSALLAHLDALDARAISATTGDDVSLAAEIPRLTAGWRALLADHAPGGGGRCPNCASRWRQRSCGVFAVARQYFLAAEPADAAEGTHRHRPGRGRRDATFYLHRPVLADQLGAPEEEPIPVAGRRVHRRHPADEDG